MSAKMKLPRWLRKRRERSPAEILVAQADAMRDAGDPVAAAILYKRAIELGAKSAAIRKQLGNMLKDTGNYGEAFTAYTLCLQQEPTDSDTLLQLGHLFKLQGNVAEAANYYTRAANGFPPSPHAMVELAALNTVSSSSREAEAHTHVAARQRPHIGPRNELHELIDELSARMDRLAERVAMGNPHLSNEDQVSMQETRNNWYAFVPLFLNTASTIARMGHDIEALATRTESCERKLALQPPGVGTGS